MSRLSPFAGFAGVYAVKDEKTLQKTADMWGRGAVSVSAHKAGPREARQAEVVPPIARCDFGGKARMGAEGSRGKP